MVKRSLQLNGGNGMRIRRHFAVTMRHADEVKEVVNTIKNAVSRCVLQWYREELLVFSFHGSKKHEQVVRKRVRRLGRGRPQFDVLQPDDTLDDRIPATRDWI